MPEDLTVAGMPQGPLQTNGYIVAVGEQAWLIDPSHDPRAMLAYVVEHALTPVAVVLTHAHFDHIAGLGEVRAACPDVPIHLHADEHAWLTDTGLNLSAGFGEPIVAPDTHLHALVPGEPMTLGGVAFDVRHTPGHSPGSVTLVCDPGGFAVVGDTLFAGSIGRTDFPNADHATLLRSIREQLLTLPDETAVLPGHGPTTTIGAERSSNPYLNESV